MTTQNPDIMTKDTGLVRSTPIAGKLSELVDNLGVIAEAQREGICRLDNMKKTVGSKERINEAKLILNAILVAIEQCDDVFILTGRKSHVKYNLQSKGATERHKIDETSFLMQAKGMRIDPKSEHPYTKLKDFLAHKTPKLAICVKKFLPIGVRRWHLIIYSKG